MDIVDDNALMLGDGSRLNLLSLSSNILIRGDVGVNFKFDITGGPVAINVELTDSLGNDSIYRFSGKNGTLMLPADGTERQKTYNSEQNVPSYTISSIYIYDANGTCLLYTSDAADE